MKKAKLFMMLALLVMGVSKGWSANVTVSPKTGKLVAASTYSGEVGFSSGWSAMWRHEQLPLTFTVADDDLLSDGGEISNPAGNMSVNGSNLVIMGGESKDLYCVLSLPKGYHITGYKLVMLNNLNGETVNTAQIPTGVTKVMYETDDTYDINNAYAQSNSMGGSNSTNDFVIERSGITTNHLYFRMTHTGTNYFGVTIKSFEIWFTAEGAFDTPVVPDEVGKAVSLVSAPFSANKTDIGVITPHTSTDGTKTFYAYDYRNVQDVNAYTYIYQRDAISNGVPTDVSATKKITPVKVNNEYYYAFGADTFYVETPVEVTGQTGIKYPIGYRITGAKFDCMYGTQTSGGSKNVNGCHITYQRNYQTYYLNEQLQFTTSEYTWIIDDLGNICTHNGKRYLSCYGSRDQRDLSFSTKKESQYNLRRDNQGYIYYTSGSGTLYYLQYYTGTYLTEVDNVEWYGWEDSGDYAASYTPKVVKSTNIYNTNNYQRFNIGSQWWPRYLYGYGCYRASYRATSDFVTDHTITYDAFTPGGYTLKVFDAEGDDIADQASISASSTSATAEVNNLNNDAVKFVVEGLPSGTQALVKITLTMEALDPYIDKMNIVCHDPSDQFTLSQTFTANDFSVAGGKFTFFVPESKKDSLLTLSFSDLYSKYGDETYYDGGIGNGRYSYVTSEYFKNNLNIYADTAAVANTAYDTKVVTSTAGNIRWKFNNAENLSNTSGQTTPGYLEEYPFSLERYIGSSNPDSPATLTGDTIQCQLKASSATQKSGTYYVFTADETRYNIAPSTAWQHRYYAFYRMDIELKAQDFTPVVTPTQVYNKTFYESTTAPKKDSQWGVKVSTVETITIDNGNGGTKQSKGYLTAKQILDGIADLSEIDTTTQVLYVDGSDLLSIVEIGDTTISALKDTLGRNVLIYLPENTSSNLDNVAFKTTSGTFRAGNNIVLTDKYPFFAPFDIKVDDANWAIYKREITNSDNGKVTNATILLPFTIDLTNGVHENFVAESEDDSYKCKFTMYQMNPTRALSHEEGSKIDYGTGYFTKFTGKNSLANVPYVVSVDNTYTDANSSYLVRAFGSLVKATPKEKNGVFTGETAQGELNGVTYNFTNTGTYNGKEIGDQSNNISAQDATEQVFYFAHNYFLDSRALAKPLSAKMLPFRAFYAYTESGTPTHAKMSRFSIAFGENPEMGGTNGIKDVQRDADLAVIPGKGIITLMARAQKDVTIHAVSGITVDKCSLNAGETRTVSVPAGVYVINGVKMVVK